MEQSDQFDRGSSSEEEIEEKLQLALNDLKNSLLQIKNLKIQLSEVESMTIGFKVKVDSLVEELRCFRAKYPSKCKLTKI